MPRADDETHPMDHALDAVPFPIPYQGSKRKLARRILRCFPGDVLTLHEPFCGSAAVTIGALAVGKARRAALNDSNAPLMALWQAIIERPTELADQYEALWTAQLGRERTFYDETRDAFNREHRPDQLLYLLARCVKAAVRYNAAGEFNQSPDNRRKGAHPKRMRDHIERASAVLADRVDLSSVDFRDALLDAKPDDVVYMDPPYQGVSTNRNRRYRDSLDFDDFVVALEDLNDRGISYIISYDGRTGARTHGKPLPETLHLGHFEIDAGRSTQATFLGEEHRTVESLYLSPALTERLGGLPSHLEAPLEEALHSSPL